MNHRLKVLGVALIAVLALTGIAAGAAHAETPIMSELASPAVTTLDANDVTGTEDGKLARFTIGGGARYIECTAAKQLSNATVIGSATTVTATPTFEACFSNGLKTVPVTVTHNGCTFTLTATKENGEQKVFEDLTIDCPEGKSVEVHVYESEAAHAANKSFCTYTIKPQTVAAFAEVTSAGAGATRDITLNMTTGAKLKVVNDGTAGLASCALTVGGEGSGVFSGKITVTGTNASQVQVGVFLG